mgnify:CR=1 FL=1
MLTHGYKDEIGHSAVDIIKFIPDPVIIGFTAGIGIIILVGQCKDFFRLPDFSGETFHAKLFHPLQLMPQELKTEDTLPKHAYQILCKVFSRFSHSGIIEDVKLSEIDTLFKALNIKLQSGQGSHKKGTLDHKHLTGKNPEEGIPHRQTVIFSHNPILQEYQVLQLAQKFALYKIFPAECEEKLRLEGLLDG